MSPCELVVESPYTSFFISYIPNMVISSGSHWVTITNRESVS